MNTARFNSKSYQVPESWNELTRKQQLFIAKITLSNQKSGRIKILWALLGLKWRSFRLWRYLNKISPADRYDLQLLTDFLFHSNTLTVNKIKTLFPSIWDGRKFYGPGDNLKNMTISEFSFADSYYLLYRSAADGRAKSLALAKFIAVLYRPMRQGYSPKKPSFAGDIREDFNEKLIPHRANLFKTLSPAKKQAIIFFFEGCRADMVKRYENVFSVKGTKKQSEASKFGWAGIMLDMAGSKFGTLDETAKVSVHTFLMACERAIIINNESEKT